MEKESEPELSDGDDSFDLDVYLLTHLPEYDEYIGKHLLVSLTYVGSAGAVDHKVQFHGIITRINEAIIAVLRQDTGEEFTLPADMSALTVATQGEYRLKPSGDVVVNPDFLAVWTIQKAETIQEES